jgi:hypothetical protein
MRAERLSSFPTADSPKPAPLLDQWGALDPFPSLARRPSTASAGRRAARDAVHEPFT